MTSPPVDLDRDRVLDLQADRALQGLDDRAEHELRVLLIRYPDMDTDEMDLAAAALDLAWSSREVSRPVPVHLKQVLRSLAVDIAGVRAAEQNQAHSGGSAGRPHAAARGRSVRRLPGWLIAAGCLGWIAALCWRAQVSSLEAECARLVATSPDLMRSSWQATEDPAARGLTGDLIWSNADQRGFMRFRGLAANDRSREQYQLWIFDRGQAHPVDGGVFDSGGEEVLVPIDAKLKIDEPWQFAVTVEKPGGVVVSSRERVVALAAR